jgi:hypothetical protein
MWIEAVKHRSLPTTTSTVAISHDPSRRLGLRPECANRNHWPTTCKGAKSTKANALEAYAPDDGPKNGLSGSNRARGA